MSNTHRESMQHSLVDLHRHLVEFQAQVEASNRRTFWQFLLGLLLIVLALVFYALGSQSLFAHFSTAMVVTLALFGMWSNFQSFRSTRRTRQALREASEQYEELIRGNAESIDHQAGSPQA